MEFTFDLPAEYSQPTGAIAVTAVCYLVASLVNRRDLGFLVYLGGFTLGTWLLATRFSSLFAAWVPIIALHAACISYFLTRYIRERGGDNLAVAVVGFAGLFLGHLAFAVGLVLYLTLAAYLRAPAARRSLPRLAVLLALRLFALFLTLLTIARPALIVRSGDRIPSVLILLLDHSASMEVKDEYNNQTRFEAMRSTLQTCQPILKELQDEAQITTVLLRFAGDVSDWTPEAQPDGRTTDYGSALAGAYQRFGNETNLRGLLVIGDGRDHGQRFNPFAEARRWKTVPCPINAFVLGFDSTRTDQKDIAITNLIVEPAPVFVKGRMTIKATIDAPGCENAPVEATLLIDGKPANIEKLLVNGTEPKDLEPRLPLSAGNELRLETTAPDVPGEIRVTVRIKPLPGEVTAANNEVSTYVTIAKEGVSVLLVAPLDEETKYLRQVLMSDPRIRLFETTRQTDDPPRGGEAELFNFGRQAYDVIILRNVSARRLAAGNPGVLAKVRDLVRGGAGFLMMGGFDSFGGSPPEMPGDWGGTPIADLLPVQLDAAGQITSKLEFHPTPRGNEHYLLQLRPRPEDTRTLWNRINDLIKAPGANRLGTLKPGADLLATSEPNGRGVALMAAHSFGKGRTLAFAGDTTYLWRIYGLPETTEGIEVHGRFWKQAVLWLAHQENSEGSVWIKPDLRRLAAGAPLGFGVGVRGKSGVDLAGGRFDVRVIGPDGTSVPTPTRREGPADRGQFWQTMQAGEYRLEVTGEATDTDGKAVTGSASVRFLVYQDEREVLQTAADTDFLGKLAAAGGGRPQPYRIDDLPEFLTRLKTAALPSEQMKIERYPDWRDTRLRPFLPAWLVLFVVVLCLEWGLRRLWGLV